MDIKKMLLRLRDTVCDVARMPGKLKALLIGLDEKLDAILAVLFLQKSGKGPDELLTPDFSLPSSDLPDNIGYLKRDPQIRALTKEYATWMAKMASLSVFMPFEEMTALFQQSVALAANTTSNPLLYYFRSVRLRARTEGDLALALSLAESLLKRETTYFELARHRYGQMSELRKEVISLAIAAVVEGRLTEVASNALTRIKDNGLLSRNPGTASFAMRQGRRGKEIEGANDIFQVLGRSDSLAELKNYLAGKTVALIGNGATELGKENGRRIDEHEVVVRIGFFHPGENYRRDYGQRTDLWILGSNGCGLEENHDQAPNLSRILFVEPMGSLHFLPRRLACLRAMTVRRTVDLSIVSDSDRLALMQKCDPYFPSTGLAAIDFLLGTECVFSRDDVFGFSFMGQTGAQWNNFPYHYGDRFDYPDTHRHNALVERTLAMEWLGAREARSSRRA